ncbi:hypothetical protein D2V17_07390 [Aurantiacibacter xanthus]|uniref:Sel1 repeat family protein n=2 Tax=Aurantiacibacter xanthus TaxID=1784712 RepID=A0A3A1P5M8_9SPHN|nr:hypothetical protein D2V17_07390 [Aurantiacibacter xanthus]
MSLSWARGSKDEAQEWSFGQHEPDWSSAELHFLMATRAGYWAGFHNLGQMYRHGFGVRHDPELAFHFILRAVELISDEELDASMDALRRLFELDWGNEEDRAFASALLDTDCGETAGPEAVKFKSDT